MTFHARRRLAMPRLLEIEELLERPPADIAAMIVRRLDELGRPWRPFAEDEPQATLKDWALLATAIVKLLDALALAQHRRGRG